MLKSNVMMKKKIMFFIALLVVRSGLLPLFLLIADRWSIRRKAVRRLSLPLLKKHRNSHFQILLYHRVNDEDDPFFRGIPTKVFERQMEILCRFFNVLPLEELMERMPKGDIPPNAVAITFDDGYRDNYENGFPILKRFNLPAAIFLTTGGIDSQHLLWHDRVFDAFRWTKAGSVSFEGREYPLRILSERRSALDAILGKIRMCTPEDRENLIGQLIHNLGVVDSHRDCWQKLTWQEIDEMSKERISFLAHTVTHPILTRMPIAGAENEILASKATIEKRLRCSVRFFSYPNGSRDDFNESIKKILKDAGFMGAVTTLWGTNGKDTNPFELRRIKIWGDLNLQTFALRLGWYEFSS